MKPPLKLQPFRAQHHCENASVLANAWDRSEQLWPLNVMEISMHLEFLVLFWLIENPGRVASRLLQVDRGDAMIATDFTADSIPSRYCSGYRMPFSAKEGMLLSCP